jgi:hypothetical protein
LAGFFCLLSAPLGCSRNPKTYRVRGTVEFASGQKVDFGTVEFRMPQLQTVARGLIQPDGRFRLSTFKPGDGAVAGDHEVVIVQTVVAADDHGHERSHHLVDRRFARYETSGLRVTVAPQRGEQEVKIIVE